MIKMIMMLPAVMLNVLYNLMLKMLNLLKRISFETACNFINGQRGILVAGELTFDKVDLQSANRTIQINPVTDCGAAKVIIKEGKIESTGSNSTRTIMLWGNNVAVESSLIINDDIIIAPISSKASAAINLGAKNATSNTIEINSGTIVGYTGIRLIVNGESGITVLEMTAGTAETENTEIYLYGGTITAEGKGSVLANTYDGEKFIKGGQFSSDVSEYLAADISVVQDES